MWVGTATDALELLVVKAQELQALHDWAQRNAIGMRQTVAVGDGANDLPMIAAAGLGIAFCAKPKVRAAAPAEWARGAHLTEGAFCD